MPIDSPAPLTPTEAAVQSQSGRNGTERSGNMLDKDGFLRLLVAQLRQQDPMAAVSNEEIMGQMTQLAMVEQVTNMTRANEQMVIRMDTEQALSLIGKEVTYIAEDESVQTGTVERVVFEDGIPTLTIDGVEGISPGQVTEIG